MKKIVAVSIVVAMLALSSTVGAVSVAGVGREADLASDPSGSGNLTVLNTQEELVNSSGLTGKVQVPGFDRVDDGVTML